MKKKIIVGVIASVVAVGGAVGASAISDSLTSNNKLKVEADDDMANVTLDTNTLVSVEELYDIVLSEVDGTIEEIELEAKNENYVYFEVEVKQGNKEYKVYVDAYTGKVLAVKVDDKDDDYHGKQEDGKTNVEVNQLTKADHHTEVTSNIKQDVQKEHTNKKKNNTSDIISKDQAINIALGLASGTVSEIELEKDDGRLQYEIEIDGLLEAEITIDAMTGQVIEFELDD